MMTVKEVSLLTGISVRTLHYYDEIGLLRPQTTTEAGYRMYSDKELERLQQILLLRELEFSLKEIKSIIDRPGFDRNNALSEQIQLLKLKKEHIENLITLAEQIRTTGGYDMSFKTFDKQKIDSYKKEAKKKWGDTEAYHEYEKKASGYSDEKQELIAKNLMMIFKEFGDNKEASPADSKVQALVRKLQDYITDNYYSCTKQILMELGKMYAAGGEMTDNIDAVGGKGTGEFAAKAIIEYCK